MDQVIETKQLRKDIDAISQRMQALFPEAKVDTLPLRVTYQKLTEATMWLGQYLKNLGEANPYPNSRDTTNTIVEPTADGLKF